MEISPVLWLCSPLLLLLSVGVGILMANIGKVRGWDTQRASWASFIIYLLLMIVAWPLSAQFLYSFPAIFGVIGLVVSPLVTLAVRRKYPDVSKTSSSSRTTLDLNVQGAGEKKPSPQKQKAANSGRKLPPKPEPAATPGLHTEHPGHIFVSYRRSDSADIAGRIYDRLIGKFGRGPVFKDVDSIPLGLDFKEYLDQKVGECDVLLAIIGDNWLNVSDSTGKKRIEDPTDFVRIEIQSALKRGIPVIPLLVRGAQMPSEESLPSSLRKLVYRNGIPIRTDPDFHRDMDRLIAALEKYVQ
jgi:hypothetical protein